MVVFFVVSLKPVCEFPFFSRKPPSSGKKQGLIFTLETITGPVRLCIFIVNLGCQVTEPQF